MYGDFVYIGRDKSKVASQNVWIHDSDFKRNGRQGIAVTAATNVIIERNHFYNTRRSTIDLEPNSRSWHVSNVFVLEQHRRQGSAALRRVTRSGPGRQHRDLRQPAARSRARRSTRSRRKAKRRSNWIITDNVSDTTVHNRPMRFFGIDGLVVSGNTQRVSGEQPGRDPHRRLRRADRRQRLRPGRRRAPRCDLQRRARRAADAADPRPERAAHDHTTGPPATITPPTLRARPRRPSRRRRRCVTSSDNGNGLAGGLAIGAVVVLAAVALGLLVRSRRRRRDTPPACLTSRAGSRSTADECPVRVVWEEVEGSGGCDGARSRPRSFARGELESAAAAGLRVGG